MSENSHSECQCITDDEIDILFHNGERVVSGSITSHIGGRRYEVQAGDISKICLLAETLTEANNLFGNYFSIHVDLGSERKQVVQMERPYLTTIDGQLYRWEQVSDEPSPYFRSAKSVAFENPENFGLFYITTTDEKGNTVYVTVSNEVGEKTPVTMRML